MSKQEELHSEEDLFDAAAGWIVKLRSPAVSERDHIDFSHWLNASPAHQTAFDEMLESWELMALGAELPESSWNPKVSKRGLAAKLGHLLSRLKPGPASNNFWLGGLVSAAALALVAIAVTLDQSNPTQPEIYQTATGEQQLIELADGSTATLNTHSKIAVAFTEEQRLIQLLEGEAFFQVAPSKRRPFVVESGRGTVTAVGTAFNVYRKSGADMVTVTEGVVRVKQSKNATTPYPESKFVRAREQLALSTNGLSKTEAAPEEMAWLNKTLSFDNTELAEALAELNRYLSQPVKIDHPSLRQLRISGTFRTDSPEETLSAIITTFNLQRLDDGSLRQPPQQEPASA
ncbi:FecR family protein [Halioxenophilus sp. WMMB6]|uniref:FecR family protein n=1 Tax=Halioxenophilus sp. WMMB6 TaxID=3073815 RepID=UPI00295F1681|nr:FecR family protein [Halioxenophilus sp. WMMB6]